MYCAFGLLFQSCFPHCDSPVTGIIGGAVVGLLCAVLLVMFIVYRMRKKDEGSYALEEPKMTSPSRGYHRAPTKEYWA